MRTITLIIGLMLISVPALAQRNEGCTKPLNEKYSFKDFQNQDLSAIDPAELNNTCIKGTNFYQDSALKDVENDIFPDIIEVEFVRCNLDNVLIPPGNTVKESSHRMIKVQNDGEEWIVEKVGNNWRAKEPKNIDDFIEAEVSVDPKDIPAQRLKKRRIEDEREKIRNRNAAVVGGLSGNGS